MPRVIFHVDMDSFYASVEMRENPALRNVPLIIGADPKNGTGRGVVAACSYEARKYGVKSGQPISRAYRLCPQGTYIRPDFTRYAQASETVMELLRGFSPKFEQVSVDEAFLDVTRRVRNYGESAKLAEQIMKEVERREGLTCSVGIAPNKSIAKIASDMRKPNGLMIVPPENVKDFLSSLPVSKISGVGKKSMEILAGEGIHTIGQLASLTPKKLVGLFGKNGVWLWAIANGLEETEVQERSEIKSLGAEHTFENDTDDRGLVAAVIDELTTDIHQRLISAELVYGTVAIKIRFEDFQTFTRAKTRPELSDKRELISDTSRALLKEFKGEPRKIRLIGVRVSNLKTLHGKQSLLSAS